jgi:hypothetical protein
VNDTQHESVVLLHQAVASFDVAHVIDLKILKSILKEIEVERAYDKLPQAVRIFDRLNEDLKRDIQRRAVELAETAASSRRLAGMLRPRPDSVVRPRPDNMVRTEEVEVPPRKGAGGKRATSFLSALNGR